MIKDFINLFTRRKEQSMQERAERSRELKRSEELKKEIEDAADHLDKFVSELKKRHE